MLVLGGVRGHLDRARALRPDGPHKPAIVMATYVVVLFSGTVVVGQRRRKRGEVPVAREQRKLAAILAANVVGYSRLIGRDESGTLARLFAGHP